jgi:hypothetical protein
MNTTQTPELPPFAASYVERFLERRPNGSARLVKAPEGVTLVRLSWTENYLMRGGYTQDNDLVRWVSWAGEECMGTSTRKVDAIDLAVGMLS